MTMNITMAAAHAHPTIGLACQLASASAIPMKGNAAAARSVNDLNTISGFSFGWSVSHLAATDARATRFQAPPERLGEPEQRFFQDRHHEPVNNRPSGFLRLDEARLLQYGEMGGHGGLRDREVIRKFSR